MVFVIKDKETGLHLARQDFKPSDEYLVFWVSAGFIPVVGVV